MMNTQGGAELSEKLPDELFHLVESLKNFIRDQKAYRDQKFDVEPILEVEREADELMLAFQHVSLDSDICKKLAQQITDDTTKLVGLAESAYSSSKQQQQQQPQQPQQQPQQQQHQQQHGATASQYFAELADQFESRMRLYGEQIKELKMSLDGIVRTHNADELFKWLDKQHKSLGEIGAKVYMTHERIMEKKAEMEKMKIAEMSSINH